MLSGEKETRGRKPFPAWKKLKMRTVMLPPEIDEYLARMDFGSAALMREAITSAVKRHRARNKEQAE